MNYSENEILYFPSNTPLSEIAQFYHSNFVSNGELSKYMFFIDGTTYIPYHDQTTVSIELADPENQFTQSLASWLSHTQYFNILLFYGCSSFFIPTELQTKNAACIRLEDLNIAFNRPYLLMIQHNTTFMEFQFSFRNLIYYFSSPREELEMSTTFLNSSLPLSAFPLIISKVLVYFECFYMISNEWMKSHL